MWHTGAVEGEPIAFSCVGIQVECRFAATIFSARWSDPECGVNLVVGELGLDDSIDDRAAGHGSDAAVGSRSSASFLGFCELCERLLGIRSRNARRDAIAEYLASLSPVDAGDAARLLVGRVSAEREGGRLSIGWRTVSQAVDRIGGGAGDDSAGADFGESIAARLSPGSPGGELALGEVVEQLRSVACISGRGSRARRSDALVDLFGRASQLEAKYLAKVAVDDMRQGAREGVVLDALARLSGVEPEAVRRAQQAVGDLGALARCAKEDPARLSEVRIRLFDPIKPMLAQSAPDVASAFEQLDGALALEWKLDGARVQIHADGNDVRIFTRRLNEVSDSLPELVELLRSGLSGCPAIVEGEVLAVRNGRVLPFQELMRRFRRKRDVGRMVDEVPVEIFLFDILQRGGESLLDAPAERRWEILGESCGKLRRVERIVPKSADEAEEFYRAAVDAGHEGVMAKSLSGPYAPGSRGKHWLKVKRVLTADLAVIAAEWGYGRRRGWLSNYHLAARAAGGELAMVGKTFKGPTDAVFRSMTERLQGLKVAENRSTVFVRPQVVAEVRFDGVQESELHDSGLALRFARIVRFRDDKRVEEVDSLEALRRAGEASAATQPRST